MDRFEQLKAWNTLKSQLQRIQDPCLRKLYHDTFVLKAIEDWGFNPEKPDSLDKNAICLNKDEKKTLERIKVYQEYGIDPYTKEEKEELDRVDKEFRLNMLNFVRCGNTLTDMPEEFRNSEFIREAYFRALKKVYQI